MMVSTLLVIMMSIPGLALFYGGLVRSKNMLSILLQVFTIFSVIIVLWCLYGYSIAFTEGNAFFGKFDRAFLNGIWDPVKASFSTAATFSKGVVIPEFVYVVFQGTFAAITGGLTLMLAAIGAISLLVGGIGIMNIMLVSVSERTSEIGLRKAIGARSGDVLAQFLIEALVLSSLGGVIGSALGLSAVAAVAAFTPLPAAIGASNVLVTVGLSGSIGLIFGVLPARRASRLDPITALRSL